MAVNDSAPVLTWQELARLQIQAVQTLPDRKRLGETVAGLIVSHFTYFGIIPDGSCPPLRNTIDGACGTRKRYEAIQAAGAPNSVEDFLIGSEVVRAARQGIMPEPPYAWLKFEPDCLTI